MLQIDRAKLIAAKKAVEHARQSLSELYKAEDPILAEHAYELLEPLAKMEQKLDRLLIISK